MNEYEDIYGNIFGDDELLEKAEADGVSVDQYKILKDIKLINVPSASLAKPFSAKLPDKPRPTAADFPDVVVNGQVMSKKEADDLNVINPIENDAFLQIDSIVREENKDLDIYKKQTKTIPSTTYGFSPTTVTTDELVYDKQIKDAYSMQKELHETNPIKNPEEPGSEEFNKKADELTKKLIINTEIQEREKKYLYASGESTTGKVRDILVDKGIKERDALQSELDENIKLNNDIFNKYKQASERIEEIIDISFENKNLTRENAVQLPNGRYISRETYTELYNTSSTYLNNLNLLKQDGVKIQEQINKLEDFDLFIDVFSKNYSTSEKLGNQAYNKVFEVIDLAKLIVANSVAKTVGAMTAPASSFSIAKTGKPVISSTIAKAAEISFESDYDKTVISNLKKQEEFRESAAFEDIDSSNVGRFVAEEVFNQILNVGVMTIGGTAGLATGNPLLGASTAIALYAGSDRPSQMVKEEYNSKQDKWEYNDVEYSDREYFFQSVGVGLSEGLFSALPTSIILTGGIRQLVKNGLKGAFNKELKYISKAQASKSFITKPSAVANKALAKKYAKEELTSDLVESFFINPAFEVATEEATTLSQNLITGRPLLEGVGHTAASSLGFGILMGGSHRVLAGALTGRFMQSANRRVYTDRTKQIQDLRGEIEGIRSNTVMSEDVKGINYRNLNKKLNAYEKENNNLYDEAYNRFRSLDKVSYEIVKSGDNKLTELKIEAEEIFGSNELNGAQKKEALTILSKEYNDLKRNLDIFLSSVGVNNRLQLLNYGSPVEKGEYDRILKQAERELKVEKPNKDIKQKEIFDKAQDIYMGEMADIDIENNKRNAKKSKAYLDYESYETVQDILSDIPRLKEKYNLTDDQVDEIKKDIRNTGGFEIPGGKLYVTIRENAIKNQREHVASHEVAHKVAGLLMLDDPRAMDEIELSLAAFLKNEYPEIYNEIVGEIQKGSSIANAAQTVDTSSKKAGKISGEGLNKGKQIRRSEFFTAFVENVAKGKIDINDKSNDGIVFSLGNMFNTMFKTNKFKETNFKGNDDIIKFVTGLAKKIKSGELTSKTIREFAQSDVVKKLVKKSKEKSIELDNKVTKISTNFSKSNFSNLNDNPAYKEFQQALKGVTLYHGGNRTIDELKKSKDDNWASWWYAGSPYGSMQYAGMSSELDLESDGFDLNYNQETREPKYKGGKLGPYRKMNPELYKEKYSPRDQMYKLNFDEIKDAIIIPDVEVFEDFSVFLYNEDIKDFKETFKKGSKAKPSDLSLYSYGDVVGILDLPAEKAEAILIKYMDYIKKYDENYTDFFGGNKKGKLDTYNFRNNPVPLTIIGKINSNSIEKIESTENDFVFIDEIYKEYDEVINKQLSNTSKDLIQSINDTVPKGSTLSDFKNQNSENRIATVKKLIGSKLLDGIISETAIKVGLPVDDFTSKVKENLIKRLGSFNPEFKNEEGQTTKMSTWLGVGKQGSNTLFRAMGDAMNDIIENKEKSGPSLDSDENFLQIQADEDTDLVAFDDLIFDAGVAQEVTKTTAKVFREKIGIEPGQKLYDEILNSTLKDIETNIESYVNSETGEVKENLIKELKKKFQKSSYKSILEYIGAARSYESFLEENILDIIEKIPLEDLVQMQKEEATEVFATLEVGISKVSGQTRVEGKSGASSKELAAAEAAGIVKVKNLTSGKNIYSRSPVDKQAFIKYFFPPPMAFSAKAGKMTKSNKKGERKKKLVELLSRELSFDAYTKAMMSPELSAYTRSALSETIINKIAHEIDRDPTIVNFQKTIPFNLEEITPEEISNFLQNSTNGKFKSDANDISRDLLEFEYIVTTDKKGKKIYTLREDISEDDIIDSIKNIEKYDNVTKQIVIGLWANGLIKPKTQYGGFIREGQVIAAVKLVKNKRLQAKDQSGGNNPNVKDVTLIFELNNGKEVKLEIEEKQTINSIVSNVGLNVNFNELTNKLTSESNIKDIFSIKSGNENHKFLLSLLENGIVQDKQDGITFLQKLQYFNSKFKDGIEVAYEEDAWKEYQQSLYKKNAKQYPDGQGKRLSFKVNLDSLDIGKWITNASGLYMEFGDKGLWWIGEQSDSKNYLNMPSLFDQVFTHLGKKTKAGLTVRFRVSAYTSYIDSKTGVKMKKIRVNATLEFDSKTQKSLPKSNFNFTNEGGIDTIIKESDSKINKQKSEDFNKIIEQNKGILADETFSETLARQKGRDIGKYKFFVPPSADDFMGLIYSFLGKGKLGEEQKQFFEDQLNGPYKRGISRLESAKQKIEDDYRNLKKQFPKVAKKLGKKIPDSNYSYDQAIRVYLWKYNKEAFDTDLEKALGLSGKEINDLFFTVTEDQELQRFARGLGLITGLPEGYVQPEIDWSVQTIVSDINDVIEKVGRKKFLNEFIENKKEIFNKENLNKIEAIYGTRFREALEDSLYAMTNGTSRNFGDNKIANVFADWLNGSTGVTMFFNTRSAALQLISNVNYLNWSDNNFLQAAKAFANFPQYMEDFVMIINSNKLKQRRKGLNIDVQAAELASSVATSKSKYKSLLRSLLRVGFTPTQAADATAIAMGGATFYRNRVNTYLSKGFNKQDAETKAFEDFSELTDASQQSADPSRISQEQRNPIARFMLTFQNTSMQYDRLIKKSYLDLVNRRGNDKENISKIIYYGVAQNLVFNGIQQAMFSLLFEDDEEEDKRKKTTKERSMDLLNSMVDTLLKGSGYKGAIVSTLKNTIIEFQKQEAKGSFKADHVYTGIRLFSLAPTVGTKLRKLYKAYNTNYYERDVIAARGFAIDNPIYEVYGSILAAAFNIPADRLINKINNIKLANKDYVKTWQAVALLAGWPAWGLNVENKEHKLIKTEGSKARKEAGYKKSKETRRKNKLKNRNLDGTVKPRTVKPRTIKPKVFNN